MTIKGTVLYYTPEKTERTAKLKAVFVRQGLRIRNVGKDELGETVGYLAGIRGYEPFRPAPANAEEEAAENGDNENGGNGKISEISEIGEIGEIPEEVLVMKGFTRRLIDDLLLGIRKAGLPKIALKAIITDQNAGWTFYHLYEEIKKEHEAMSQARDI